MPEAVDVGSVLGGRYKVTAYVLASAEKDLVLDGVDQILNRPVSILVASAGNASQVATSARELATGDRHGSVQVLDLSVTDGNTYLVTNRAPAADLLDLIIQQDAPRPTAPYVEPFFTDTLGSEIFGGPRSTDPETDEDDDYHGYDEEYDDEPRPRGARLAELTRRFRRREPSEVEAPDDDTTTLAPVAAPAPRSPSAHRVPPPPTLKPGGASAAPADGQDSDDGHDDGMAQDGGRRRHDEGDRRRIVSSGAARPGAMGAAGLGTAGAAGIGAAGAAAASVPRPGREESRFPLSGRTDDDAFGSVDDPDSDDSDAYNPDEDDTSSGRTFTRVLVGVVMAIVLVVAVFAAATTLGSISGGNPVADTGETDQVQSEPAAEGPGSAPPSPTAEPTEEPTPDAVEPVITGVTRLVPTNPSLDASNDGTLPLITDGNPSTFWGNLVYASDTFGGLATNLALVVELEEESTISQVNISQLNGSGGSFTVLVNDQPVLEGAEQIAQGGFTGPTVSLPIPDNAGGATTAQYVIINFTQLPRLSNIQATYPFGLRIAEISVD